MLMCLFLIVLSRCLCVVIRIFWYFLDCLNGSIVVFGLVGGLWCVVGIVNGVILFFIGYYLDEG